MPIDNKKPPDPVALEFCELTGMSPTNLNHSVVYPMAACGDYPSIGKGRKPRRNRHGSKIRVSTPGSASAAAGSALRNLRSSKLIGKVRKHVDSSPGDNREGKRANSCHVDDVISDVLGDLKSGAINSNLKLALGDNTSRDNASSRDGITVAKTGSDEGKAGLNPSIEHTSMDDVVNTGVGLSSVLDGIASYKDGGEFEFGRNDKSKGILKKPSSPLFKVQFGDNSMSNPFVKKPMIFSNKAWNTSGNGNKRIQFSAEEVYKGGPACFLQLYGYFVGTSMDYRVVRGNLRRMWRVHGIEEITKTSSGIFYFKFKSEEGMKNVLESGPWMIQNVPLVLNTWEPGIWLDKVEASSITIWVCVYNIPMELCNGNGIGKIMSGVGKPMVMDKMTRERCLKKAGKLDFARVLVEVSAHEELPNVLEIEYPSLGNRPAKIGKLEVKPRIEEETSAMEAKAGNIGGEVSRNKDKLNDMDEDGFITVGKKNKPAGPRPKVNDTGGNGVNQIKSQLKARSNVDVSNKKIQGNGSTGNSFNSTSKGAGNVLKKPANDVYVARSLQQLSKDPNYKPKVLVRGSSSKDVADAVSMEPIPVNNSFQALTDDDMDQAVL
nr:hypothetical protein [Tanacetum cinerariifolium]